MNEIALHRGAAVQISDIDIYINDAFLTNAKGDGYDLSICSQSLCLYASFCLSVSVSASLPLVSPLILFVLLTFLLV
jgi:hypothetical protein